MKKRIIWWPYRYYLLPSRKRMATEAGAEFFSDAMFPEFNKLLSILKVPVRQYPLTYTFYNTVTQETLVLPPVQVAGIIFFGVLVRLLIGLILFILSSLWMAACSRCSSKITSSHSKIMRMNWGSPPRLKSIFYIPFLAHHGAFLAPIFKRSLR